MREQQTTDRAARLTFGLAIVGLIACVAAGEWISRQTLIAAPPSTVRALTTNSLPEPVKGAGLIVHEWGTFTTFSGSDGVHLDYRPLDVRESDLPWFVQDRAHFDSLPMAVKRRILARVRMETPVTYFYTDTPRTVRVKVDFPEGMLTEFYPPVRSVAPKFDRKTAYTDGELVGNSSIDWGEVRLLPPESFRPAMADEQLSSLIQQHSLRTLPPDSSAFPHYQHARIPEAAMVHSRVASRRNGPVTDHFERFLFYRGVGKFQMPLHIRFDDDEQMVLENSGDLAIRSGVLIDVQGETIRTSVVSSVAPHSTTHLPTAAAASVDQAADQVIAALVDEGLFLPEAKAMVATWRESWFTEQGTRLLYMVPAATTDELLPLSIEPAPEKILRVLVGRLEMMTPATERAAETIVAESLKSYEAYQKHRAEVWNQQGREAAEALPHPSLPNALIQLDRFAEPSLARVIATSNSVKIQAEAKRLLQQLEQARRKAS